jgi:hypothetical protein
MSTPFVIKIANTRQICGFSPKNPKSLVFSAVHLDLLLILIFFGEGI